jgi:DNA-binding MarR family transcriptional regulator
MQGHDTTDIYRLEHTLAAFIRAFGLHQGEQTPCGISVSVSEAHTLTELARTGGLSQKDLIQFLKLEKSTISRLIQNLEKRGWVKRSAHPSDGRSQLLMLTPGGEKKAIQIAKARRAKFEILAKNLPRAKRETVLAALDLLTEAMNESKNVF